MSGLCECGCGQPTRIAAATKTARGVKRGEHCRFVKSHSSRHVTTNGYKHKTGAAGQSSQLHVIRAEAALGRPLPVGVQVHHVDGDIGSRTARLVICQDQAYHLLLHRRARIIKAGGNPNTQHICRVCRLVKDITQFPANRSKPCGLSYECRSCRAVFEKSRSKRYRSHRVRSKRKAIA